MPLPIYLAMTESEFHACQQLPHRCAWMACHFSPYGKGLTNIPTELPPDSILMVNDCMPPQGHDPEYIAQQLLEATQQLSVMGVLLDFQRPFCKETAAIAAAIRQELPCPVAVTPAYAEGWDSVIFLPPIPLDCSLDGYFLPWKSSELWLELSAEGALLRLTSSGCDIQPVIPPFPPPAFQDGQLFCGYSIELGDHAAAFHLQRAPEDQAELLCQAEKYGVTAAVGLYQEACSICPANSIDSFRPHYKEAGYGKHLS